MNGYQEKIIDSIQIVLLLGLAISFFLPHQSTPFFSLAFLIAIYSYITRSNTEKETENKVVKTWAYASSLFFLVPMIYFFAFEDNGHFADSAVKPLAATILLLTYQRLAVTEKQLITLLTIICLTAGIVAAYEHNILGMSRVNGGSNAVLFGINAALATSVTLYWFLKQSQWLPRLALGTAVFAGSYAVLASGTRMAWLLLSAIILILLTRSLIGLKGRSLAFTLLIYTIIVGVLLVNIPAHYKSRLSKTLVTAVQLYTEDPASSNAFITSGGIRASLSIASIDAVKKYPMGIGREEFYSHMSSMAKDGELHPYYINNKWKIHNQLLSNTVHYGLIGGLSFLFFSAITILLPLKTLRQASSKLARQSAVSACIIAVSTLFFSVFDVPWSMNASAHWIIWSYLFFLGLSWRPEPKELS